MGLKTVSEFLFEFIIQSVVDIEVQKILLMPPLGFEPVHDGRHLLASMSPESEELYQSRFAGCQHDRLGIRGLEPLARCWDDIQRRFGHGGFRVIDHGHGEAPQSRKYSPHQLTT